MELLSTQPCVLPQLPETIDLLVLDGGEYTTYPEFVALRDRTRIFALDDTAILKCSRVRKELLESGVTVYKEDLKDRNGWGIYYFKGYGS